MMRRAEACTDISSVKLQLVAEASKTTGVGLPLQDLQTRVLRLKVSKSKPDSCGLAGFGHSLQLDSVDVRTGVGATHHES